MNNTLDTTIEHLKGIICDPNCNRMNLSTVKGYLGELYIKRYLEKSGVVVEHKGNQSRYDLEIISDGIKIDVKYSSIKGTKKLPDWGWALNQKSLDKVSCTHFVCIGVDDTSEPKAICIIKAKDLEKFPNPKNSQFKNVNVGFSLQVNPEDEFPPENEYFKNCTEALNKGLVKVIRDLHNMNLYHHIIN